MDAEIPLPMCANPYQYQICIPELKGKCQEEKKEKLMVRIGETNPINQKRIFLQTRVKMEFFLASRLRERENPSFQSSWQIEPGVFLKMALLKNLLEKNKNWSEFKLEINCRPYSGAQCVCVCTTYLPFYVCIKDPELSFLKNPLPWWL